MKKMYKIAILFFAFSLCTFQSFSQDITADTALANKYCEIVKQKLLLYQLDSVNTYLNKAQLLYVKYLGENSYKNSEVICLMGNFYYYNTKYSLALDNYFKSLEIAINLYGENHKDVARYLNNIGKVYCDNGELEKALDYLFRSLNIRKKLFGENHFELITSYHSIGMCYYLNNEFDKALEYYNKKLKILKAKYGESHREIALTYISLGVINFEKAEYDKALDYYKKCLEIQKTLTENINTDIAYTYNNIGNIYYIQKEYEKALEYHFVSMEITKNYYGEKHMDVAMSYINIGWVYQKRKEFDKALIYYNKGLEICKEILGDTNIEITDFYNSIGTIYYEKGNYDIALKFYYKAIEIEKTIYIKENNKIADLYNNIGLIFFELNEHDKALEFFDKSMKIKTVLLGEKHNSISDSYKNIGAVYFKKNDYIKTLIYYHKAILSNLRSNEVSSNFFSVPKINDYFSYEDLLVTLQSKAQIFANDTIVLEGFEVSHGMKERYKIALRHYQACDTLINQVRKEITMLSDKIALGEKANQVYNEAVEVCLQLSKVAPNDSVDYYKKLAFEYSEKNKSSVLLESLAGAQAMQFSGIPDSLLEKEHNLQIDIALYKRLLSEQTDSAQTASFRDKLFNANRNYEELIQQFEKNYTQYYNLKYGQNLANVNSLQQTLDKTTAIISYQETDSVLYVFYIDKTNYQIYTTPKRSNYQEIINVFRQSLVNTAPNNSGLSKAAHFLYKQLFPFTIESHIQNLIIIPEGSMCLIPFEALLTEEYKGNPEQYSNYAYLVKKYNISYAYSASLFYRTFPKTPTKKVEVTQLNDWLAMAPVFDDVKTGGASFRTRQLLRDMEKIKTDTITTRAFMLTGEYITPLPGTEQEVKNIFNKFEGANKKALVQLNANANETFVKSEEIKNYKYLHFASHGIVNMQKPELSGIILAQDSALGEDGILYSGEIYNLKLNADLTVLSACETGLGEIKKGEGLIGLTRALLYAGSKNIIVSLWKVADNSTSQLMVDFYDVLLKDEKNVTNYSSALRQAKLKMINEGKYSHPFYWSPFILIGK